MSSELKRKGGRSREQLTFSDTYKVLDNLRAYDFDLVSFYVTFIQYIDRNAYHGKPDNSLIFRNNTSLYKAFNISKNKFYRLLKISYECGLIDIEKGKDNRNIYILNDLVPQNKLKKLRHWDNKGNDNEDLTEFKDEAFDEIGLDQKGTTGCPKLTQPVGPKRSDQNGPTNNNISNTINNSKVFNNLSIDYSISTSDSGLDNDRKTEKKVDIIREEIIEFEDILRNCEIEHIEDRYRSGIVQALRSLYFSEKRLQNGDSYIPRDLVRSDMKKLNYMIIIHAIGRFKEASKDREIRNTVGYLKACIYNAISSINFDVEAELRHKGII